MTFWAIADLHLSFGTDKPMDVFGDNWKDHANKIKEKWLSRVKNGDTVLIAGDISWGMTFDQALPDLLWIDDLPGKKILIRGNHDYWWEKISRLRKNLPPSLCPLQNDHVERENYKICGSRGWMLPVKSATDYEHTLKIFRRERIRLEMSLDSAGKEKSIIVMMHYPPLLPGHEGPDFTDILEKNRVEIVVYGHLHAKDSQWAITGERKGVKYVYVACDGVNFSPVRIV